MEAVLIYGLVYSVTLALIAIGFSLTFGISGVANLAYGAMYILSGYFTWQLFMTFGLPYAVSAILAVIGTALVGALIYRLVLLRIRGLMLSEVIATFGLGIGVLEFLRWAGLAGYKYKLPHFVSGSIGVAGVAVDYQLIFIVAIGLLRVVFLWYFPRHTRIGLAIDVRLEGVPLPAQSHVVPLAVGDLAARCHTPHPADVVAQPPPAHEERLALFGPVAARRGLGQDGAALLRAHPGQDGEIVAAEVGQRHSLRALPLGLGECLL